LTVNLSLDGGVECASHASQPAEATAHELTKASQRARYLRELGGESKSGELRVCSILKADRLEADKAIKYC
jgi:hypothetical protein